MGGFILFLGFILLAIIQVVFIEPRNKKKNKNFDILEWLEDNFLKFVGWIMLGFIVYCIITGFPSIIGEKGNGRKCYDKTSMDRNRDNDYKCKDANGNIKRTSAEGAKTLMGK